LTELPNRVLFMERLQRRHPPETSASGIGVCQFYWSISIASDHQTTAWGTPLEISCWWKSRTGWPTSSGGTILCPRPAALGFQHDTDTRWPDSAADEFTILLEDIRDPSDAVRVAERIQAVVGAADRAQRSGGVITPASGSPSGLRAPFGCHLGTGRDLAMHGLKPSAGDKCAISDSTMHHAPSSACNTSRNFGRAVERQELVLHYQPIVELTDSR